MDKNVNNVIGKFLRREAVGLAKYGVTTERTDIDLLGWIEHLQDELMDATLYLERMKHEVQTLSPQRQLPVLFNRRESDLRGSTTSPATTDPATLPSGYPPVMSPPVGNAWHHVGPEKREGGE